MYKGKYLSIFSKLNGGYCVYYPSNIFCNTRSFENWGNSGIFPSFNSGIFGQVMHLDQLRSSENI